MDPTKAQPNTPILIGGGQLIQRKPEDLKTALGPIDMMAETVRRAAHDAGLSPEQLATVDSLRIVRFITGKYEDPISVLTDRLGIDPETTTYTTATGGESPQTFVNEAAQALAEGRVKLAVLAGAEAIASFISAAKQGIVPDWVERDGAEFGSAGSDFDGTSEAETPYDLQHPINVYPLFENAIRAHHGWTLDEHARHLGELLAPFSKAAAANPYAWFPREYTAEEIATVTPDNRMVGFPYTKRMNAVIRVDQSAALILTTVGHARELDIDPAKWVFLHGCSEVKDHWFITERENYYSSEAFAMNARKAFDMAGKTVNDIDFFDLYSCFPSAVQVGRDALGIPRDDPRPLTVAGGLPYHGGPVNNYVTHSIATMMNTLRAQPGAFGVCTGVGWFNTKNALGIYSTQPIQGPWKREDPAILQAEVDARPKPELALEPSGRGKVETYTIYNGREGTERAVIVGRLEDDRRFLAVTPDDPQLWQRMMSEECIGQTGTVQPGAPVNTFTFD